MRSLTPASLIHLLLASSHSQLHNKNRLNCVASFSFIIHYTATVDWNFAIFVLYFGFFVQTANTSKSSLTACNIDCKESLTPNLALGRYFGFIKTAPENVND